MAYIVGEDRNQVQCISISLDDLIEQDNPVCVIDAYVDSLDLVELGFTVYDGKHKGRAPYRRSDLLCVSCTTGHFKLPKRDIRYFGNYMKSSPIIQAHQITKL